MDVGLGLVVVGEPPLLRLVLILDHRVQLFGDIADKILSLQDSLLLPLDFVPSLQLGNQLVLVGLKHMDQPHGPLPHPAHHPTPADLNLDHLGKPSQPQVDLVDLSHQRSNLPHQILPLLLSLLWVDPLGEADLLLDLPTHGIDPNPK